MSRNFHTGSTSWIGARAHLRNNFAVPASSNWVAIRINPGVHLVNQIANGVVQLDPLLFPKKRRRPAPKIATTPCVSWRPDNTATALANASSATGSGISVVNAWYCWVRYGILGTFTHTQTSTHEPYSKHICLQKRTRTDPACSSGWRRRRPSGQQPTPNSLGSASWFSVSGGQLIMD